MQYMRNAIRVGLWPAKRPDQNGRRVHARRHDGVASAHVSAMPEPVQLKLLNHAAHDR